MLNAGDAPAYDVDVILELGPGVTLDGEVFNTSVTQSGNLVTFDTNWYIPPGHKLSTPVIPLLFAPLATPSATSRLFILDAAATMNLLPNEDSVYEELDQPLVYPLVFTNATLTGIPFDTDHVALTTHTNAIAQNYSVYYVWWRQNNFDLNGTSDETYYMIANQSSYLLNDTVFNRDTWTINYFVTVHPAGSNLIIATTNTYQWTKSTTPWWFALVIALPIAVAALAALIGAAIYAKKTHPEWFAAKPKEEKKKKEKKPKKEKAVGLSSLGAAEGTSSPATAAVPSSPTPLAPGGLKKEYTVNIDYIMTGAKAVRVKDGNPTSPKPDEGQEYSDSDEDMPNPDGSDAPRERAPSSSQSSRNTAPSWRTAVRNRLRKIFFCF